MIIATFMRVSLGRLCMGAGTSNLASSLPIVDRFLPIVSAIKFAFSCYLELKLAKFHERMRSLDIFPVHEREHTQSAAAAPNCPCVEKVTGRCMRTKKCLVQ